MQKIDLTGKKFGRLTVIEQAKSAVTPKGCIRTMWRCKCDCGNEVIRSSQNLRNVPTPSCGCLKSERTSERKLNNLIGQRFGRLVVLSRADGSKYTQWHCKCDCGNECDVLAGNLVKGHTTSCGCFREENRPNLRKTHGERNSRLYSVWCKMKDRCYCVNNPSYPRYGGRGITICDEWRNDFVAFRDWAYSNGYDETASYGESTFDRIDNSKGYSPDNCRIVNEQIQANNRRTNKLVTYNGETHTVAEWSRILGINQGTLTAGLWAGRTIEHYVNDFKPRNTHPKK